MFSRFLQGIISCGAALAVFSILATGMYYVMPVTTIGLVVCAIAAIGTMYWVSKSLPVINDERVGHRPTPTAICLGVIAIASLGAWWYAVLTHPVLDSVRSPWLVISPSNLIWLFIPAVCATILLARKANPAAFGIIVLTLFSALSFAAAAYPLGFGFDPFLHRATIQHIAEHGTITPKPLYYIGEYMIELFAMKVLHLPLMLVDAYLVPLLAATLIPAAVFLRTRHRGVNNPAFSEIILLFLPIAAFVQTTPQALAFVFTAVAILLADRPRLAAIFAIAALAAHPIAGLPAVFFVTLTWFAGKHRAAFIGTAIVAALALPLAFIAQSVKAHMPLGLHFPTLSDISTLPITTFFGTHFNAWGDTAYLVIGNMFIVTVVLGIIGVYRTSRGPVADRPLQQYVPLICACIAFSNFLILGLFFEFPFLISYERTDFAARMLTLTVLFLLPYVPDAFRVIPPSYEEGGQGGVQARRAFAVAVISIVFVSTVYGAFPRYDAYASSAAFNVTKADFDAVKAIENYAAGRDYVVLANQATSSAAISELGFKKYYHGDIYFYPIPTGGPLYQLYLDMADKPIDAIIEKTRSLTGAQLVFFVMDDYWWDSKRVIEQTKSIADDQWIFGNKNVTVSVFE
jgi:hypothetical protein